MSSRLHGNPLWGPKIAKTHASGHAPHPLPHPTGDAEMDQKWTKKRVGKRYRKSEKRGFPGDFKIGPKSTDLCKKIKLGGLPVGCQKGTAKK